MERGGAPSSAVGIRSVGAAKAFEFAGRLVAENSGEQAHGGVENDGGSEFSAGENIVSDREFAVGESFGDALVDSFIASADEDDALHVRELARGGLRESLALRGEQDNGLAAGVAGFFGRDGQRLDGFGERFRFEHHAFAASKGTVVDGAVAVVGEAAQVVHGDADRPGGEGAGDDSVFQDAGEEARKDGDDVELHVLKIARGS